MLRIDKIRDILIKSIHEYAFSSFDYNDYKIIHGDFIYLNNDTMYESMDDLMYWLKKNHSNIFYVHDKNVQLDDSYVEYRNHYYILRFRMPDDISKKYGFIFFNNPKLCEKFGFMLEELLISEMPIFELKYSKLNSIFWSIVKNINAVIREKKSISINDLRYNFNYLIEDKNIKSQKCVKTKTIKKI